MTLATVLVLAAETAPGVDLTPIVNVGAFGVLSLLLLGFSYTAYKREAKRADAATADLLTLQTKVIDLYAPGAAETARVLKEFLDESRRDRR